MGRVSFLRALLATRRGPEESAGRFRDLPKGRSTREKTDPPETYKGAQRTTPEGGGDENKCKSRDASSARGPKGAVNREIGATGESWEMGVRGNEMREMVCEMEDVGGEMGYEWGMWEDWRN